MTDRIPQDATSTLALALRALPAITMGCALAAAGGAFAADAAKVIAAEPAKMEATEAAKVEAAKAKPMNMNAPMAGGMKKEGMKLGDVKKAEQKWDRKMRGMMEKEQPPQAAEKK